MDEHTIELEELYERLGLQDPQAGLTQDFVDSRLRDEGDNALTERAVVPWWLLFLKQMTGFFSLLLWLGGVLCFIGYFLASDDKSNLYLGIVLFAVVFLTGCFSFY